MKNNTKSLYNKIKTYEKQNKTIPSAVIEDLIQEYASKNQVFKKDILNQESMYSTARDIITQLENNNKTKEILKKKNELEKIVGKEIKTYDFSHKLLVATLAVGEAYYLGTTHMNPEISGILATTVVSFIAGSMYQYVSHAIHYVNSIIRLDNRIKYIHEHCRIVPTSIIDKI